MKRTLDTIRLSALTEGFGDRISLRCETLTDGSLVYSICIIGTDGTMELDCIDEKSTFALFAALADTVCSVSMIE